MLQHLVLQLMAASVLVTAAPGGLAQTPPPATPTTRILAIGTFAPGTDMQLVQRTPAAEVRATAKRYLQGKIDLGGVSKVRAGARNQKTHLDERVRTPTENCLLPATDLAEKCIQASSCWGVMQVLVH